MFEKPLPIVFARWAAVLACVVPSARSTAAASASDRAREILAAAGVRRGLIVHLGCGEGELTTVLARAAEGPGGEEAGRTMLHAFDADAAKVAAARTRIRRARLDQRVWVDRLAGANLPYAENMANLVVVSQGGHRVPPDEVARILVPGGVAYARSGDRWKKTVKPRPGDIDEWTHWLHGADGNAVAKDKVAGPPRRFRWAAGPLWSRSHDSVPSVSAFVSAGGRVFYIVDEAPASMAGSAPDRWALVARDAFNGLKLWRLPISEWGWRTWARRFTCRFTVPTHVPRRLVADGSRVYVTLGFNALLTELDAADGTVVRRYAGTRFTDEILCTPDRLIVSVNKAAQKPGPKTPPRPEPVRKSVAAIDRRSGRTLWKTGDYVGLRSKTGPMERISHLSLAAGGGKVYFIDRNELVSLNAADGTEAWRVPRPHVDEHKMRYNIRITDMCSLVYGDGRLFFAQLDPDRKIDWREVRGRVHAFSAATGKALWSRTCSSWGWGHPADVFLLHGLVWISGFKDNSFLGLDPQTGEVKRRLSNRKAFDNGHHHRCYRNKATARYLITSFRGLEFIDWSSGRTDRHHWVRGTCRLGVVPCNGMVYATPHPCDCYITSKLNGFVALQPAPRTTDDAQDSGRRLERGPAYAEGVQAAAESGPPAGFAVAEARPRAQARPGGTRLRSADWPTYRGDPQRSGATRAEVRRPLKTLWQMELGGALSSPVAAGGRVVVARKAAREVVCLSADGGKVLWRQTAGGRIDTPPTLHRGRAVFGGRDGWVYCLRLADGALVWRFRAAPRQRLVGAFDGIESAWPVHGSVLAIDGLVYCTAGRSSFLDGGIHAWALKIDTGEAAAHQTLRSDSDMDVDWGRDQTVDTGVLSDLLVAGDEGGIYLRQRRLFGRGEQTRIARHLRATGGFLDSSWFHRTRWFLEGVPLAEYLVFDGRRVLGVRARKRIGGYGGHFTPGAKGFDLFAARVAPHVPRKPKRPPRAKPKTRPGSPARPRGASSTPHPPVPKDRWCIKVPVRVSAMVLAGRTLLAAGTPDVIDAEDPWAAYEGRRGGKLLVVSADDGTVAATLDLAAPPVPDGLAVAGGRAFLSTTDGKLTCLGAK